VVELPCRGDVTPVVGDTELTFDADGNPIGDNTVKFGSDADCIPTETETGGADSVSYECTSAGDECLADGPQADPIEVLLSGDEVTVTVTNTFPVVVAPLVIAPTFTG
jgi:hypothetical protein